MALSSSPEKAAAAAAPPAVHVAPVWPAVLFILGLVLLYVGQGTDDGTDWRLWVTAGAVALTVGSTLFRLAPQYCGDGAAPVARMLIGVQCLGLLGVALCLANTGWLRARSRLTQRGTCQRR